jgi:hypothetical protein
MSAKHGLSTDCVITLFLVYAAKKHAEAAPGVGTETDIVVIGSDLGMSYPIAPDSELQKQLDSRYDAMRKSQLKAIKAANTGLGRYLEEKGRKAIAQEQQSIPADATIDVKRVVKPYSTEP